MQAQGRLPADAGLLSHGCNCADDSLAKRFSEVKKASREGGAVAVKRFSLEGTVREALCEGTEKASSRCRVLLFLSPMCRARVCEALLKTKKKASQKCERAVPRRFSFV